ncbi:hypothetical protein [Pseudomonas sp. Marseille-Q5115]|uniref:hypothetical protein n=1 Tax=Pseudomonas sp. Marseille-Q5115 TaxID=2866593 RepID=UPI001CE3BBE5|nr:hypothetical protein [Pseudomonas sp. Marseille-Q5115]
MLKRGALILSMWLFSVPAWAVQPGDPITPWTLLDQFDRPFTLDADTHVLLVARSMAAARLVNAALDAAPTGYLEDRHTAYIADIEHMPSVARAFAIPAMRSARYRILLDGDGRVAPRYDGAREGVQWLEVRDGTLRAQQQFNDAAQLRQALERLTQ